MSPVSSSRYPSVARHESTLNRVLRCEIIAPLGNPVVPDVYRRTATSSGEPFSGAGDASRPMASRKETASLSSPSISTQVETQPQSSRGKTFSNCSLVVTSAETEQSDRMYPISGGDRR